MDLATRTGIDVNPEDLENYEDECVTKADLEEARDAYASYGFQRSYTIQECADKMVEVCSRLQNLQTGVDGGSSSASSSSAAPPPRKDVYIPCTDDGMEHLDILYDEMFRSTATSELKEQLANTREISLPYSQLCRMRLQKIPFDAGCLTTLSLVDKVENEHIHLRFSMDPCHDEHVKLVQAERKRVEERQRILQVAQEDLHQSRVAYAANMDLVETGGASHQRPHITDAMAASGASMTQTLPTAEELLAMNEDGVHVPDIMHKNDIPSYITDHVQCNVILDRETSIIVDVYFTLRKTIY